MTIFFQVGLSPGHGVTFWFMQSDKLWVIYPVILFAANIWGIKLSGSLYAPETFTEVTEFLSHHVWFDLKLRFQNSTMIIPPAGFLIVAIMQQEIC